MKHIMVDLETFSLRHHAVIISLGAVWFEPNSHTIKEKFYVTIDPVQSQKLGFRIDAGTAMWWMDAERAAAWKAWTNVLHFPPELALQGFDQWLQSLDDREPPIELDPDQRQTYDAADHRCFWGNGVGFDNELLKDHYEVLQVPAPWNYRNDRDFRTFKMLPRAAGVCPPFEGTVHNAVDDAEHQARWLQNILGEYNITV